MLRIIRFFVIVFLFFVSCSKSDVFNVVPDYVTDIDGNKYKTVVIGNQVWMSENLKTTRYNDGILINYYDLPGSTSGEYRWYEDKESNKTPYGAYYNYYAVASGKLAPEGWRIATKEDYERLKTTLGGNLIAGGQMKLRETGLWNEPNELNGEDCGFNAYPAGSYWNQNLAEIGKIALWWTSSPEDETHAVYYMLENDWNKIMWDYAKNTYFFNVRCIKE